MCARTTQIHKTLGTISITYDNYDNNIPQRRLTKYIW